MKAATTTTIDPVLRLIDGALLRLVRAGIHPSDGRRARRLGRIERRAFRSLATLFSRGRYRRRSESIAIELLSASVFEAGEIAERERLGELTPDEARRRLGRVARIGLRRVASEPRVRWGVVMPRPGVDALNPYPVSPDADYLVRFAFWRCVTAVEVREWRRFTLRDCEVAGCRRAFVEGRHGIALRGGPAKRCPACREKDRRTKR